MSVGYLFQWLYFVISRIPSTCFSTSIFLISPCFYNSLYFFLLTFSENTKHAYLKLIFGSFSYVHFIWNEFISSFNLTDHSSEYEFLCVFWNFDMQITWLGNLFFLPCPLLTLSCLHFPPRDFQTGIRSFIASLVLSGYAAKRYGRSSCWTSGQLGPRLRGGSVAPISCLPKQWLWKQSLKPFSIFFMVKEAPYFSTEPETISFLPCEDFWSLFPLGQNSRSGAQQASGLVFWAWERFILVLSMIMFFCFLISLFIFYVSLLCVWSRGGLQYKNLEGILAGYTNILHYIALYIASWSRNNLLISAKSVPQEFWGHWDSMSHRKWEDSQRVK